MDSKFTVINSTEEDKEKDRTSRIIKLCNLWERQYHNTVLRVIQKNKDIKLIADYPQEDLMKAAFCGIKYINLSLEKEINIKKIKLFQRQKNITGLKNGLKRTESKWMTVHISL